MTRFPIVGFLTLLVCAALAQTAAKSATPAFDVASIKPNPDPFDKDGPARLVGIHVGPGTLTMKHVSLMDCIRWSFQLSAGQVSGPNWLGGPRFDIVAKASGPAAEAQLRLMMQTLLAERFKMTFHRETKQLTVYNLLEAKGGVKCKSAEGPGDVVVQPSQPGVAAIQRATFAQAADFLSDLFQQPVVDKTGLKGRYNCNMDVRAYVPDPSTPVDAIGLISAVLKEQFGLKVEAKKTPMELVVVDHLEKTPTAN
jgi:uncharacterized protein (TIGR03435 family)